MDPQENDDLQEIANEAYIYAYPIVLMDISRQVMTNYETPEYKTGSKTGMGAPMNQFGHMQEFPDAAFTDVVRPNADTLYSSLWFDVSQEPLVISVPDSGGRYYLLPMLDLWTDVFASPGTRTTGTGPQQFAIAGPKWQGDPPLPDGVELIRAPTAFGWLLGRPQTNGTADYEAVHKFQKRLTATPLSAFVSGKPYTAPKGVVDPAVSPTPPVDQVEEMDAATFFARFCEVTKDNPPHANDYPVLERLKRIGIEPGQPFVFDKAPLEVQKALNNAASTEPTSALSKLKNYSSPSNKVVNGWVMVMNPVGTYGTDYLKRANIAYKGLGANCVEDAIYPFTSMLVEVGDPDPSGKKHTLHFEKEEIPPARAFWSLTMYNDQQFFADNPIDRYAIGDRDPLKYNADGSLDLYIQRESPGADKESNWLPAPEKGGFSMNLRLYWPKPEALDGTWNPPSIDGLQEIAIEAYVYAYPIVLMDISRQVMTNYETPQPTGKGAPINQFSHARKFPDDKFKEVVRPNADTLYSSLWFNVSKEPLVISVPDSSGVPNPSGPSGRYYLLPMLDLWTDVFATPGTRTTGTKAQTFAIVGPKWHPRLGERLPDGVEPIRAPTAIGWLLGRTKCYGTDADYKTVYDHFQKGLTATPLSAFGKPYTAPKGAVDRTIPMTPSPVKQVEQMDAKEFFARFYEATKDTQDIPPHPNDYSVLARLKRIGIEPGQRFDFDHASQAVKAALIDAVPKALEKLKQYSPDKVVNGWVMIMNPIGTYGTDYLKRANIAHKMLGANCVEDAIYPLASTAADGQPFHSSKKYTLHFKPEAIPPTKPEKEQIPPARAFWSLTMYNDQQLFAANDIHRYAIGDRDNLKNEEGGDYREGDALNLYIQRESPGADKESNWLPAPQEDCEFSMNLRVYWPTPEVLDGTWYPPPVMEVKPADHS